MATTTRKERHSHNPATLARRAAQAVADWNERHKIGTPVRYWKGVRQGEPSGQGPTRSEAQDMGSTAVVWVDGCSGCVALSHVEVVT